MDRENHYMKRILDSLKEFRVNGEIETFQETCSTWILRYAEIYYGFDEDETSDLCFEFLKRSKNCLDFYFKNNYTDFSGYFKVFVRNMAFNMIRSRNRRASFEYLLLWNNIEVFKSEKEESEVLLKLREELNKLKPFRRAMFLLQNNLELSIKDLYQMEKFCKMKNWDFLKFKTCYEKKLSRVKFRKEKLAMLMNMYTRRIYSEVEAKEEIRKHKKTICEKYNKEYKILSQREISKIFGISRYRLRRLNSQTALFLREKIESQFSFNNPSEISRAA